MFTDASDGHWGSFLTLVPQPEDHRIFPRENMAHPPVAFPSGVFKGSQVRWSTNDKEVYAILDSIRRLDYFVWNSVRLYNGHRNLAYIYRLEACLPSVSKALPQWLENWRAFVSQYAYRIRHIPGERHA